MKIIFVRHGESEGNAKRIVQGQLDTLLTEKGITQARALAKSLKNVKLDLIFCSTMKRARQTLDEVFVYHKNAKMIYDDRLVEMHFGEFQGGPREPLQQAITSFKGAYENFKPNGGESFNDLLARVNSFLKDLKKYKEKNVLIIAHGRTIRTMLSLLLKKSLKEMMNSLIENATITELELNGKTIKVHRFNEGNHLKVV